MIETNAYQRMESYQLYMNLHFPEGLIPHHYIVENQTNSRASFDCFIQTYTSTKKNFIFNTLVASSDFFKYSPYCVQEKTSTFIIKMYLNLDTSSFRL